MVNERIKYLIVSFILLSVISKCASNDCLLNAESFLDIQPLILLASTRELLPLSHSPEHLIKIPQHISVILLCPRSNTSANYFEGKFYMRNEILAKCVKNDTFEVEGGLYKFDQLRCSNTMKSTTLKTDQMCNGPNLINKTTTVDDQFKRIVQVGYQSSTQFIPIYKVCFDFKQVGTIYAVSTIYPETGRNYFSIRTYEIEKYWNPDKDLFGYINLSTEYLCQKQAATFYRILGRNFFNDPDSCCFSRLQLVNSDDLIYVPQKTATYHYVNVVPHCSRSNWIQVEERIRMLSHTLDRPLRVWTGVYREFTRPALTGKLERPLYMYHVTEIDSAMPVPLFMWKVVYDDHTDTALVIIEIADARRANEAIKRYVMCEDVCDRVSWMNIETRRSPNDGYIYCCDLESFLSASAYKNNDFPPAKSGILDIDRFANKTRR